MILFHGQLFIIKHHRNQEMKDISDLDKMERTT